MLRPKLHIPWPQCVSLHLPTYHAASAAVPSCDLDLGYQAKGLRQARTRMRVIRAAVTALP